MAIIGLFIELNTKGQFSGMYAYCAINNHTRDNTTQSSFCRRLSYNRTENLINCTYKTMSMCYRSEEIDGKQEIGFYLSV